MILNLFTNLWRGSKVKYLNVVRQPHVITAKALRRGILVNSGIPTGFLDALKSIGTLGELRFIIKSTEAADHYIPQILESRSFLAGWNITPICDGANGEMFYVHLEKSGNFKFVLFALEGSSLHRDFGADFQYMLADLLIQLHEFSEASNEELSKIGAELGFVKAALLFSSLRQADIDGTRATFALDQVWRATKLPAIVAA